jgi:hypothetical protein
VIERTESKAIDKLVGHLEGYAIIKVEQTADEDPDEPV